MNLTCLILCAGRNSRWNGYRNVARKHLIEIEGEILLNRTVRLIQPFHRNRTVVVINESDRLAYTSASNRHVEFFSIQPASTLHTEAYKYLSSSSLWNADGKTIVLLGDVWYSEEAIKQIFNPSLTSWTAFGRSYGSQWTGCPYGELFAQSFYQFDENLENLCRLDAMYRLGTCYRSASGWAHYNLMIGVNPNQHTVGSRFVEIDDFTEDFDCASDIELWTLGRIVHQAKQKLARSA